MVSSGSGREFPPNLFEQWMRDYYFRARFDISSSGVEPLTMRELCELTGLQLVEFWRTSKLSRMSYRMKSSLIRPRAGCAPF